MLLRANCPFTIATADCLRALLHQNAQSLCLACLPFLNRSTTPEFRWGFPFAWMTGKQQDPKSFGINIYIYTYRPLTNFKSLVTM